MTLSPRLSLALCVLPSVALGYSAGGQVAGLAPLGAHAAFWGLLWGVYIGRIVEFRAADWELRSGRQNVAFYSGRFALAALAYFGAAALQVRAATGWQ